MDQRTGGTFPPDTQIAVGPDRILQAVNRALSLSDRDGDSAVFQSLQAHFDRPKSANLFDPRAHYDPLSNRFFLIAVEKDDVGSRASIFVSVSRSDEPRSLVEGWCNYEIEATREAAFADFPRLGMNEKWLAISTHHYLFAADDRPSKFVRPFVWVLDKEAIIANSSDCPGGIRTFEFARNSPEFAIYPALHLSETSIRNTPLFLVQSFWFGGSSYRVMRVERRRRNPDKPRLKKKVTVRASRYSLPPDAEQRDGNQPLDTLDARPVQAPVFRDGLLWVVHATGCDVGNSLNVSCIRVVSFKPRRGRRAPIKLETTVGVDGLYLWMPGVSVNRKGDVAVVYQQSGLDMYLGTGFTGKKRRRKSFDRRAASLVAGRCAAQHIDDRFQVVRGRTGDYAGIQADPERRDAFWVSGEYAHRDGGNCNWSTRVGQVRY